MSASPAPLSDGAPLAACAPIKPVTWLDMLVEMENQRDRYQRWGDILRAEATKADSSDERAHYLVCAADRDHLAAIYRKLESIVEVVRDDPVILDRLKEIARGEAEANDT